MTELSLNNCANCFYEPKWVALGNPTRKSGFCRWPEESLMTLPAAVKLHKERIYWFPDGFGLKNLCPCWRRKETINKEPLGDEKKIKKLQDAVDSEDYADW